MAEEADCIICAQLAPCGTIGATASNMVWDFVREKRERGKGGRTLSM